MLGRAHGQQNVEENHSPFTLVPFVQLSLGAKSQRTENMPVTAQIYYPRVCACLPCRLEETVFDKFKEQKVRQVWKFVSALVPFVWPSLRLRFTPICVSCPSLVRPYGDAITPALLISIARLPPDFFLKSSAPLRTESSESRCISMACGRGTSLAWAFFTMSSIT